MLHLLDNLPLPLDPFWLPDLVALPIQQMPRQFFALSGHFLFPYSSGFSTRIIRSITG